MARHFFAERFSVFAGRRLREWHRSYEWVIEWLCQRIGGLLVILFCPLPVLCWHKICLYSRVEKVLFDDDNNSRFPLTVYYMALCFVFFSVCVFVCVADNSLSRKRRKRRKNKASHSIRTMAFYFSTWACLYCRCRRITVHSAARSCRWKTN